MLFNLVNGFLNGFYLGHMEWARGNIAWLTDPRFIIGIIFFISGFFINQVSDNHLIRLRRGKKSGYYIPTHRLFRRVSCPNFTGEIIEWSGFAIMTWSLPGLSFAIWTMANLIPRALHHHNWYRETFDNYPEQRKAVIPYLL
jgi:steroid 5-alpha reductase family enzyme